MVKKSEPLSNGELEDLGAVGVRVIQGFRKAERQRSEPCNPGDAKAHRVTQLTEIDVKAVDLRTPAGSVEHVADIHEQGRA